MQMKSDVSTEGSVFAIVSGVPVSIASAPEES